MNRHRSPRSALFHRRARTRSRAPVSTGWATRLLVAIAGSLLQGVALAASLEATITGPDGHALEHAVISLLDGTPRSAPAGTRATMDQRARQFAPTVVPIQSGTTVSFPNSDDVRHHVYSFSRPNAFELRLYHGEASEPVRFEQSGIAVLGCNIHDGMVGYLAIVDTPLFAKSSAAGEARIADVESGRYTLQVWHPDLGSRHLQREVTLGKGSTRIALELGTDDLSDVKVSDAGAGEPGSPAAARPAKSPLQALFRD